MNGTSEMWGQHHNLTQGNANKMIETKIYLKKMPSDLDNDMLIQFTGVNQQATQQPQAQQSQQPQSQHGQMPMKTGLFHLYFH